MITVCWGNYGWNEEDEKQPVKRWYKKCFVGDDTFNAYVFFRKKDEDPNWDIVILEATK